MIQEKLASSAVTESLAQAAGEPHDAWLQRVRMGKLTIEAVQLVLSNFPMIRTVGFARAYLDVKPELEARGACWRTGRTGSRNIPDIFPESKLQISSPEA